MTSEYSEQGAIIFCYSFLVSDKIQQLKKTKRKKNNFVVVELYINLVLH